MKKKYIIIIPILFTLLGCSNKYVNEVKNTKCIDKTNNGKLLKIIKVLEKENILLKTENKRILNKYFKTELNKNKEIKEEIERKNKIKEEYNKMKNIPKINKEAYEIDSSIKSDIYYEKKNKNILKEIKIKELEKTKEKLGILPFTNSRSGVKVYSTPYAIKSKLVTIYEFKTHLEIEDCLENGWCKIIDKELYVPKHLIKFK